MTPNIKSDYQAITVSGKIATGTSTLCKNLQETLGWEYINAGEIQRQYDREHNRKEYEHGSLMRSDEHEREIENMTKRMLETKKNIIYEAWLAGYIAREMPHVLRILLVCSSDAVRIDRVAFRDQLTIDEAKKYLKQREEENIEKWRALYGPHDFWDRKYFQLIVDTYSSGPMETVGKVLDALGWKK